MEHLFICLLLACTCYLLYKVFRLKNRESRLKNEISVLRIAEAKAQERLDEMEASIASNTLLETDLLSDDDVLPLSEVSFSPLTDVPSSLYEETFLCKRPSGSRRQTYIDSSYYEYMSRMLPVMAPGVSFPIFLNNLLNQHLEMYSKIQEEIYHRNAKKAMKELSEWKS